MPSLSDLSNEILDTIIENIRPDDILNFSLSSKWIHLLTKKALDQHKSWSPVYTHIVLHGCHRHRNDCHPMRLIRDICLDWRIGEYPRSLSVECCGIDEYEDGETDSQNSDREDDAEETKDSSTIRIILQDIKCCIKDKAMSSGYLSKSEIDDLCWLMKEGYRAAMIGLLLLFLPNLESICFKNYTWNASRLSGIVNTVAGQDLDKQNPRALTKLSEIQIFGLGGDYKGEDLEFLVPFAALPSVRTLSGCFLEALDDDPMVWPFGPRVSNVTRIILNQSAVAVKPLTQILSGIDALKSFTYAHTRRLCDRYPMKSHTVIGALHEHARDSLSHLALTGHCNPRDQEEDDHCNKGSLLDFKTLKEAVLDSAIYVDQVPYEGSSPDPDEGIYGDRLQDSIRALVDVLPPSLETLNLTGRDLVHHVDGLLAKFGEQKDLRLPNLRKITLVVGLWHRKTFRFQHLTQMCDNVGVTLEVQWIGG